MIIIEIVGERNGRDLIDMSRKREIRPSKSGIKGADDVTLIMSRQEEKGNEDTEGSMPWKRCPSLELIEATSNGWSKNPSRNQYLVNWRL